MEKWRANKGYRIKEIDDMIGLSRMRQEVRNLQRLYELGIRVPRIESVDFDRRVFTMEYLEGYCSLKEVLRRSLFEHSQLGRLIGL